MAKFNDIFSPQTLEKLNQKSSDSLQLMMGNKNLMQIMMSSYQLLNDIIKIESPYKTTLENLAVDIVKKTYPNIKQENIGVDAKIVSISDVGKSLDEATSGERRRRVVNAFTQGASSVSLEELLKIFENHIHEINSTLYEKYNQIMKDTFGIYDNDEAIALMLAAVTSNNKIAGGSSKIIIEAISIKARAVCFPMLVHEIIKGYYGILGQNALKGDKETRQSIIKNVDKLENEPEDIKYGKYIYKAINNIFLTFTDIKDKQVQSLFIMDIFDLDDNEFFSFIENAINENLTSEQIKWAKDNIEDNVDYVNQQRQKEKDIDNVDLSSLGLEEEFKRMQKLAGLIKENNYDFNLKATKDPNAVFGLFRYSDDERAYFQDVINLLTGRSDFSKKLPNYNLTDLVKKLNDNIKPDELWQALSRANKKGILPVKAANILFDLIKYTNDKTTPTVN